MMPTLCFQLSFPRTSRINYQSLLLLVSKLTLALIFFYYIITHQFIPTLEETASKFESRSLFENVFSVLKMAMPNTFMWLLTFFIFFHYTLNILAELTLFGDRQFYKEWWNCHSFGEYWKLWNQPVHKFFVRHVFNPMINAVSLT